MQHMFNEHGVVGEDTLQEVIEVNSIKAARKQRDTDIAVLKSKVRSIVTIAQDPTLHLERKEMEILAMIQIALGED